MHFSCQCINARILYEVGAKLWLGLVKATLTVKTLSKSY